MVTDGDDARDANAAPVTLTVVIPAFNEGDIIESSVSTITKGLRERDVAFELVVVENGSTDATASLADELADTVAEVRAEHLAAPDYGMALRHGLLCARGDVVVNFDCDYFDLDFLDHATALVAAPDGPAVVVGSKRAPGSNDTRSLSRRAVTAVFSTVLRIVFGLRVSDTHGMKALRRQAVVPLATRCRFGRDLFDTELILRVERSGLHTAEIPVAVRELRPARTSIARRVPRTLLGLARLRWALWRERH